MPPRKARGVPRANRRRVGHIRTFSPNAASPMDAVASRAWKEDAKTGVVAGRDDRDRSAVGARDLPGDVEAEAETVLAARLGPAAERFEDVRQDRLGNAAAIDDLERHFVRRFSVDGDLDRRARFAVDG